MARQHEGGVTVRPARMLGQISLFAFAAILFTVLFDPEKQLGLLAAAPLLLSTLVTGIAETWGNYVRVDRRGISRVNWAGLTHQRVEIGQITGVFREDGRSWFGAERAFVVVDSAQTQMRLGINIVYRDGGWPMQALSQIVVALVECGAPVDEALAADAVEIAG